MLKVQVHPGARLRSLRGRRADGALRIDVPEPPEGGKANRAVAALLAEVIGVPAGCVAVVRGHASRSKIVRIDGLEADDLERRLRHALEARGGNDAQ
jgi:uncharacterized protein YggU (UPF0235/DUF167 family)